jgi:hypothetical protein
VAFLVATMVVSTWRSAYRDALARQDAGQKPATIRAAYTALFQRGFEGVRRCVKGTVYG